MIRLSPPASWIACVGVVMAVAVIACSTTYGVEQSKPDPSGDDDDDDDDTPIDGGGGGGGSDANASGRADPVAFASGVCSHDQRCFTQYLRRNFGTFAACTLGITDEMVTVFGADGNNVTPQLLSACLAKLAPVCVEDFGEIPECDFRGTRPDGAGCVFGSQCASGDCFKAKTDADCGVCTQRAPAGASCMNADCMPRLFCVNSTCVVPGAETASCNDSKPCRSDLGCIGGKCSKLLPNGAGCELSNTTCDWRVGLSCISPGGTTGTCRPDLFAKLGQRCGFDDPAQTFTDCEASTCSSATAIGTCVQFLAVGATCTDVGPQCAYGLSCAAGRCKARDLAACN